MRNFDVATFVAFGAAQLGVAGNDVLMEFDYSEVYAPLDLDIGHCHVAVAAVADWAAHEEIRRWSHIRVATKYPEIARRHFARARHPGGMHQAQRCDRARPAAGLCRHIVDLVQTGATLEPTGWSRSSAIAKVSSRLIVNRPALKTRPEEVGGWIERFARRGATARPLGPACGTAERGDADHLSTREPD